MPEPGVTDGYISYTQTVKPTPDGGADIALAFHKDGEIHLTRGIFLLLQFQAPEMSERVIAFTHGPPSVVSDDYRIGARGFGINLSDSTALEFSLDRTGLFERRDEEGKASMNVRLSADADAEVNIHLRFKRSGIDPDPTESVPSWQPGPQQSRLAIHGVELSMNRVPRFHVVELTVDLSATYGNPFDPEDIAVDAIFITPSGRKMKFPGFFYQGFKAEYEDDLELLSRDGEPAWKVRFAPVEMGSYNVSVSVRDRSGTVTSEERKFDCVEKGQTHRSVPTNYAE